MLSPRQSRDLTKILSFAGFWLIFGFLYVLIEKGILGPSTLYPSTKVPYDFRSAITVTPIGSAIGGLLLGAIEVLLLSKMFGSRSFTQKIIAKTGFYLLAVVIFLIVISTVNNSFRMGLSPFHPEVLATLGSFFYNFAFISIITYMGVCLIITLFVFEVTDSLGSNILNNFVTGRYHRPREEDRIFMFLDMKASTTIAEQLGHVRYYELLNQYYRDLNGVILDCFGEIYQYVGDEIVVSWGLKKGLQNDNCVNSFFIAKQLFAERSEWYEDQFGLVPGFKAGMHWGRVTTGEVGVIKKDILFTGDVLNTTARIQESCKHYDRDLLISGELKDELSLNGYRVVEIGEKQLRGRKAVIKLFGLEQK